MHLNSALRRVSLRHQTRCIPINRVCSRSITGLAPHLPPLPPISEWSRRFPRTHVDAAGRVRPWLVNPSSQLKALKQFGLDAVDDGNPKTIIELYPGPGVMSRAILSLPRSAVHRLVIMEDHPQFIPYLEELAAADDRVVLLKQSGYLWESFEEIKNNGTLDHIQPYLDGRIHPQLRVFSQLPIGSATEQLVSQWVRNVPIRSWVWSYGRVPLHFFVDDWVHHRLTAKPKDTYFGKLTMLAQALVSITSIQSDSILSPYQDHWYPQAREGDTFLQRARKPGHPMVGITMVPRHWDEQPIVGSKIDQWDFVLRSAFVLKKSPIKKAMAAVAPGAAGLLNKPGTKHINPKSPVHQLTVDDWAAILKEFDEWPFAPTVCRPLIMDLPTPPDNALDVTDPCTS
ncbi:S-adenosyl-L-methionine-dependent methyltransferase [Clavulina sp. PMI_390]|nr:S-adenosyl-L-methionine-dependent methyltransferase [Clavulina sp. PMI_390]